MNINRARLVGKIGAIDTLQFVENTPGTCEMDSHADTTCFGPNFRVTHETDQECNVYPFTSSYDPIKKVPVVSACTAYDCPETGETYILEFHQGLYFGDKLEHSLICPNQCRAYGIDLCDDPYDKNRRLRFTDPVTEEFVPFEIRSIFATFRTRVPTD